MSGAITNWVGTRVFFWGVDSDCIYGTAVEASRLRDGTRIINIKVDNGRMITLPVAAVTVVQTSTQAGLNTTPAPALEATQNSTPDSPRPRL